MILFADVLEQFSQRKLSSIQTYLFIAAASNERSHRRNEVAFYQCVQYLSLRHLR